MSARPLAIVLVAWAACGEAREPPPAATPAPIAPGPESCAPPPALVAEVARLLASAAAHATRTSDCRHGPPGQRVTAHLARVCTIGAPGADAIEARAEYVLEIRAVRDQRGAPGRDCKKVECDGESRSVAESVRLRLARTPAGYRLAPPATIPGVEMTPLDRAHDGDCAGPADPFVPRAIPLR